jgi:hypothetical protein
MVAVRRPLLRHPPGTVRIFERVVEREEWDLLVAGDLCDQGVEPADLRVGIGPAVVPRQHVGKPDAQAELLAALHNGAKVVRGILDVASLSDVVDSSLDDQDVRAARTVVEPRGDLVRALPVDPAVAELEARVCQRRPVIPAGRAG